MDKLESTAKQFLDQSVTRKNLAERAEQSLTLAYNNGLFKVTPELISQTLLWHDQFEHHFLKDLYNNPIRFSKDEWQGFHLKLQERYNEVMNDWHQEFEALKRVRKPDQL